MEKIGFIVYLLCFLLEAPVIYAQDETIEALFKTVFEY